MAAVGAACTAGVTAYLVVTVKSSRCTKAITGLRVRIQPFHTLAVAHDFDERAASPWRLAARPHPSGVSPAEVRSSGQICQRVRRHP